MSGNRQPLAWWVLLVVMGLCSCQHVRLPPPSAADRVLTFEEDAVPASIRIVGAGRVAVTPYRHVHGRQALRWDWDGPCQLLIHAPNHVYTADEARDLALYGHAISAVWVYADTPDPSGHLQVEFLAGELPTMAPLCHFEMGLNFTGWRAARVAFGRDMQGDRPEHFDWIRLTAPPGRGHLYFDKIMPVAPDDRRFQWRDAQLPFLGTHMAHEPAIVVDAAALPPVAPATAADLHTVTSRIAASIMAEMADRLIDAKELRRRFADLRIVADNHGLRGRHVTLHDLIPEPRNVGGGIRAHFSARDIALNDSVGFRDTQELLLDLAVAYRRAPPAGDRAAWLDRFLLLCRHLLDQGWAAGSSRGTTHHFGYASREWFRATLLMRDELAAAGLLDAVTAAERWYMLEFLDIAAPPPAAPVDCNMDYLNTVARSQLYLIASYPSGPLQAELMRRFSAYQNTILGEPTPGTLGGFKVDGCAFHHGGQYPAYAFGGMRGAVATMALLADTEFAVTPAAQANVRRAVEAAWLYSNETVPLALCGRHPFRLPAFRDGDKGLYNLCRDLALLGDPATGAVLDRKMAGIYVDQAGLDAETAREIFGDTVAPHPRPDGDWAFNYGCFAIHRWHNRMVTLKGYNEDVWATEVYAGYRKPGGANNFGVYQSHGAVQVMLPGGPSASGLQADGWDWNLNPGTTTIHYPIPMLKNPLWRTFMPRTGGRWTLLGETNFAGAAHLGNRFGAFAMQIVPTNPDNAYSQPPFDAAFRARKSAFCFADRVVCLGSGIVNDTAEYPTRTTLCQLGVGAETPPTWFGDASPVTAFPDRREAAAPTWFVDHLGQGYVVQVGGPVVLARGVQVSRDDANTMDTQGRFVTVWIDHGTAPNDAGYVYALLLDTDAGRTAAVAAAPTWEVRRRDHAAHVVHDRTSGTTGYACFAAVANLPPGPVAAVDTPVLVLAQPTAAGLDLAVCDPLLNLAPDHGGSQPRVVQVIVRGHWTLTAGGDHATATVDGDDTRLTVSCQHGLSRQLQLGAR